MLFVSGCVDSAKQPAAQGELILCKEKLAPSVLTKILDKGGGNKDKGVIVLKTAEAVEIENEMNLQSLAAKNTKLENNFERGKVMMLPKHMLRFAPRAKNILLYISIIFLKNCSRPPSN